VSAEQLVEAIYHAVAGNCSLLEEDYMPKQSVWGNVVIFLGATFTTKTDRFWARVAYRMNHLEIRDKHRNICLQNKVDYTPAITMKDISINAEKDVYCICKKVSQLVHIPIIHVTSYYMDSKILL